MAQTEGQIVGKLVRDLIPGIIEGEGRAAEVRQLPDDEYERALLEKLHEETDELRNAPPSERLREAADVYEVLLALIRLTDLTAEDLVKAATEKRQERGGFDRRLWLEAP